MSDELTLLQGAARLTLSLGVGLPVGVKRLEGGRNNRVYQLTMEDGPPLVLKSYHSDRRDPRDRLAAEWDFLTYVRERGVGSTPVPLARDVKAGLGLYSFLYGRKLLPGEVGPGHVAAAADFICAINRAPRRPDLLAPGSEACFSISGHLATVERRVARLRGLDPNAPDVAAAQALVSQRLEPAFVVVKANALQDAADLGAELPPERICVSPSDFGFHNALIDGGRAAFIDFEYAGRDDPAKLVCDFFCNPEVPVPPYLYGRFLVRLAEGLGLDSVDLARCDLLLSLYRIKWICIVLNDFLPMDAARRAFSGAGERAERCAAQLARAGQMLDQLVT